MNYYLFLEDESKLLDEITNKMTEDKLKDLKSNSSSGPLNPFHGGIPPSTDVNVSSNRSTPIKTGKFLSSMLVTECNLS